MQNFIIEDLIFYIEDKIEDTFIVESTPENYRVSFTSMPILNENDFLLIDKNISEIYDIKTNKTIIIDPDEEIKTVFTSLEICDFLLEHNFSKSDTLHVVGGGVIQDLGAFSSKIFKRGIQWVYYPTTLLSQCDSCIGGKTALNHKNSKNQIALFSAPSNVIIDFNFLKTLPEKEIKSGYGEIIKLFITGGNFYLENFDNFTLEEKIKHSLMIKKAVIEFDEFEQNIRKVLNYGHTFGHAIESVTKYKILHGESVLIGIYIINKLFDGSKNIENIVKNNVDISLIKDIDPTEVFNKLRTDKKVFQNSVHFVVSPEPGISYFEPTLLSDKLKRKVCEIFTN